MIFQEIDYVISENFGVHYLHSTRSKDLELVLLDYALFSHKSFQLLSSSLVTISPFHNLQNEVFENIQEELGKHTGGVPHLVTLRKGLQDLGLDITTHNGNPRTYGFLQRMEEIFVFSSKEQIAGALYALEATAVYEFRGLDTLVEKICTQKNRQMPEALRAYIDHHLTAEENHAAGMKEAILPILTEDNQGDILVGAMKVLFQMRTWFKWLSMVK